MQKSHIILMTTGGTIEKVYDEMDGRLENIENRGEFIKQKIVKRLRLPYTELDVQPLMSKDSLIMTEADREAIAEKIRQEQKKGHPIVVLHGTDTMVATAHHCHKNLRPAVPIIFSGAMVPLGMEESDAPQNVTEALLAAKMLSPGLYVVFHNQVFTVPNVMKLKDKRTFGPVE